MPWEVRAFRLSEKPLAWRELPKDWRPEAIGAAEEVQGKLSAQLPGVIWDSWGVGSYIGDTFGFEIYIIPDGPITGVCFQVRGGGDPLRELVRIAKANGWRLLDGMTSEWIDLESPSRNGWERFKAFRDRVLSGKGVNESPTGPPPRAKSVQRPDKANQEHVDAVRLGAEALRKWGEEHPFQLLELSGADLHGITLERAILTGSSLNGANLTGADLSDALLESAKCQAANLSKANLSRAKMTGIDLREANLIEALLVGADLSGNNLGEANLIGTNLDNADLTDANLSGVVVEAEDWFALLRGRHTVPRDIDRLETLWETAPAGRLKIVEGGRLGPEAAARQWFQLWPRGKRRV